MKRLTSGGPFFILSRHVAPVILVYIHCIGPLVAIEEVGDIRMPDGSRAKKDRKDSQLIIRIKGSDRDNFVALCETLDTSAAREIRAFIKDFVRSHGAITFAVETSNISSEEKPDLTQKKQKSKRLKKQK
ncbi:hypothetical protein ACSSVY_000506 [Roseovarius sp. MBR-51]